MITTSRHRAAYYLLAYLLPLSIIVLAVILQTHCFYLNRDASWLLHTGERLIAGGQWGKDIFEVNPPMSTYLYLPAVIMSKITGMSIISTLRVYTFGFMFGIIILVNKLLKGLIQDTPILRITLLNLLCVFLLILPVSDFAQREHFILAMQLPYVLLIVHRIKNDEIELSTALLSGLLMGLSICVKPYYCLTPIALFLYSYKKGKTKFSVKECLGKAFCIENALVLFVVLFYGLSLIVYASEYLHTVLPFIERYYYQTYRISNVRLLFQGISGVMLLTTGIYLLLRKESHYKVLVEVLLLSAAMSFVGYLFGGTAWFYHAYPCFVFSALASCILLFEFFKKNISRNRSVLENSFALLMFSLMIIPLLLFLMTPVNYAMSLKGIFPWQKELISYFRKNTKSTSAYYLSAYLTDTYAAIDYTSLHTVNRFPSLWLILSLDIVKDQGGDPVQIDHDKKYLINAIVEDLNREIPEYIFLENHKRSQLFHSKVICYIQFLSQSSSFRQLWRQYHYVKTIGDLDIYARNTTNKNA